MAMSGSLAEAIFDLITAQGGLTDGQVLVHFDLVAETRMIVDGIEKLQRLHWTIEGADPHLSIAVMLAEIDRLRREVAG